MSTKVRESRHFASTVGVDRHVVETTDRGTSVVKSLEIFKAGSFKDSLGELNTWTVEQLAMMASNFDLLRRIDSLPNVPVRTDHSWSVRDLVGYIVDLRVEGERLVADVEFTEPDAFSKFERGTFRSRSLEVGAYETNDGVTYWPVVLGLAFVDLPAVEGLHRKPPTKENSVPDQPTFTFRIRGVETTDFAAAQTHIDALEADNTAKDERLSTLEAFAAEQTKSARLGFVSSLVAERKILATQAEAMNGLVGLMSDEQFDAFKAVYAAAPVASILASHGDGVSNPSGDQTDPHAAEIASLEETIAMHRRAGMPEDSIQTTNSFRRLAALKAAK
jgi:uncharacterized coiled-coil protein SlyX